MSENTSKMSMARLSLRRISSRLTFLDATIESSHSFSSGLAPFWSQRRIFVALCAFCRLFRLGRLLRCRLLGLVGLFVLRSRLFCLGVVDFLFAHRLLFSFICFLHYLTCVWCATSCTFPYVILSLAKDLADRRISLRRMFRLHFVSLNMTDEKHFGACV